MKDWIRDLVYEVLAWLEFFRELRYVIERRLDDMEARIVDLNADLFFYSNPHREVN